MKYSKLKCNKKLNNRGSITIEAAVVLPLFMFMLISIISIIEIIKCYEDVEINLYKAAKEISLYIAGTDVIDNLSGEINDNIVSDALLTVLSDTYTSNMMQKQLLEDGQSYPYIAGGVDSLNYWQSKVKLRETNNEDIVDLVVTYELAPSFNFFNLKPYKVINRCRMHAWTGYEGTGANKDENAERIVYVTDTGNVYHLSRSCSHLTLSINPILYDSLSNSRNSGGGKYSLCEKCGDLFNLENSTVVYITSEGDRYHSSLTCSGLKRTINEVPISQVGDKRVCSRCVGGR